jgi:hypothetical protein
MHPVESPVEMGEHGSKSVHLRAVCKADLLVVCTPDLTNVSAHAINLPSLGTYVCVPYPALLLLYCILLIYN